MGNLRLSGHQHEGGRILGLVDVMICVVCFRYVVGFVGGVFSDMFLEMVVIYSMRRASIHAQVLPISRGKTWAVS